MLLNCKIIPGPPLAVPLVLTTDFSPTSRKSLRDDAYVLSRYHIHTEFFQKNKYWKTSELLFLPNFLLPFFFSPVPPVHQELTPSRMRRSVPALAVEKLRQIGLRVMKDRLESGASGWGPKPSSKGHALQKIGATVNFGCRIDEFFEMNRIEADANEGKEPRSPFDDIGLGPGGKRQN
ncbi:hypothetical protein Baya_4836 [Bagarius yarrelli]|uniref:Uncharacterized protein n=1 Tax=Bagarius yarrelli TaxID=175774 RepID=A0A556TRR9_BAGYA|nr:hypothetical protein Baya_4836 [Bagarius yarrelli]